MFDASSRDDGGSNLWWVPEYSCGGSIQTDLVRHLGLGSVIETKSFLGFLTETKSFFF